MIVNDNLKEIIFDNFDEFLENIDEKEIEQLSNIKDATIGRFKTIKK